MTPAVDAARRAGIRFELHEYSGVEHGEGDYALAVAEELRIEPTDLTWSLVATSCAFAVPANARLDCGGSEARGARRPGEGRACDRLRAGGISPLGQRDPCRRRSTSRRSASNDPRLGRPTGTASRSPRRIDPDARRDDRALAA